VSVVEAGAFAFVAGFVVVSVDDGVGVVVLGEDAGAADGAFAELLAAVGAVCAGCRHRMGAR
jgi:hypothetical protein